MDQVLQVLEKRLQIDRKGKRQAINKPELNAIESKLQIIEHVLKIYESSGPKKEPLLRFYERLGLKVESALNIHASIDADKSFIAQVKLLMKVLLREEDSITDQEIDDIQYELNRLSRIDDFVKIRKSSAFSYMFSSNSQVKLKVGDIEKLLFGFEKFDDGNEDLSKKLLKELSAMVGAGVGISDSERREIVQAMGYKQGHWFKCQNGHPYVIGDCGGAMQLSTCPECKCSIGGTRHTLVTGNSVATEMDGARHGAWSEAANMGNYQL